MVIQISSLELMVGEHTIFLYFMWFLVMRHNVLLKKINSHKIPFK